MNVWTVAFLLALFAEAAFVPCHLFAPFCKGGKRPLISKCICSGIFILVGVFAMLASSNYGTFAYLMLAGLCFSALGDYFLGVSMKGKYFIAGVLSFATAHIFYAWAFFSVSSAKNPNGSLVSKNEIISFIVILILLGVSFFAFKLDLGKLKSLIFFYSMVIMVMLVKAISLVKVLCAAGGENSTVVALLLGIGAVLFVVSDAVLSLILFGDKDTRKMTVLNLSTYFSAQTLLAASIYFIK